jgi:hypothetical protein
MSLNIDQIAEAFCSHRFAETYPYMADEIKWNIIGREELMGREAVINKCAEGAKFLETVSTTYPKLKIYCAETCVIVEGAAQFQDKDNQTSSVASCDVFQFLDGDWLRLLHMSLTIHNHRLSSFHQNDTPPPRCLFVQAVL